MSDYANYLLINSLLALVFSLYICKISGGMNKYLLAHTCVFWVAGVKITFLFFMLYLIFCLFNDLDDFGYELDVRDGCLFKDKPITKTKFIRRLINRFTKSDYKAEMLDSIIEKMPGEWE